MKFFKTSKAYYLNKSTYINLRWIAIIGQFITINSVKFIFNFEFNYLLANFVIFLVMGKDKKNALDKFKSYENIPASRISALKKLTVLIFGVN